MNINTAYPSTYMKAAELEGDTVYTIKEVKIEKLGQGDDADTKPIVYFEETDLGLALNKTNSNTIQGLYGPETDDWTGKPITLFTTEVDFQGKQTLAIRVRMKKPAAPKAQTPPLSSAGTEAASGGYDHARQAFDAKVESHNAEHPEDTFKDGEAATTWRKVMGEIYPGRTAKSLNAAEWAAAQKSIEDDFDAATRAILPF